MLLFGVEVHNPFYGLHGVVGVDGEEHQVPRLRQLQGVFHGVFVTHLAHADYIGRLTHRRLHRHRPRVGVDAQFALGKDTFDWRVDVFHRVFDGYDMPRRVFVAPVQHRRHGGGFTRTCCPRQNNQTARLHGKLF